MLVPTNYLNNIVSLAEEYGASRTAILKDAGVPQESLDDPEARIDAEAFARVIACALEQSGEPALGIRLGSQLRVTTHGILGYAAMASATLSEALSLITKYVQTRTPLLVASFSVRRGVAALRIEEAAILGEIRRPLLEMTTATMNTVAQFLTDGDFECKRVLFPYAEPEYAAEYRTVFNCPVEFDADATEIRFDSSLLTRPLLLADEATKLQAAKRCEEELLAIETSDDLEQRIRARLLKTTDLTLSLDQVARDLAMSPRTLRRRLQNSDTSFQRILNSVRKDLAIEYLRTTSSSVSEIADRLGYTNQSSFGRAFKGWTGQSPRHFRKDS